MREIFEDIFKNDPLDPSESARRNMRTSLRKRFYDKVEIGEGADGFAVLLDGKPDKNAISVFDAYNAANDPDLVFGVGWIPSLFIDLMPTADVFPVVQAHAGPFNW